jgi:hypothetical protein
LSDDQTTPKTDFIFRVGLHVRKIGGDYTFSGEIMSAFTKKSGACRYVVEDDRGILHIFNHNQLAVEPSPKQLEP